MEIETTFANNTIVRNSDGVESESINAAEFVVREKLLFDALDFDHNGRVNKAELQKALEHPPTALPQDLKTIEIMHNNYFLLKEADQTANDLPEEKGGFDLKSQDKVADVLSGKQIVSRDRGIYGNKEVVEHWEIPTAAAGLLVPDIVLGAAAMLVVFGGFAVHSYYAKRDLHRAQYDDFRGQVKNFLHEFPDTRTAIERYGLY